MLTRVEKKFSNLAVRNLTIYLVAGQALFFAIGVANPAVLDQMLLIPERVWHGEVWRLLSFVFMPATLSPLWLFFGLYLFYIMGSALEGQWGAFKYNVFLLLAYLATVVLAFATPGSAATNVFIAGSVFLAFATLYPEFQLYIFFVLPVKIKWLARLAWLGYFLGFMMGDFQVRMGILAALANYLVFFGRDIVLSVRFGAKRMLAQAQDVVVQTMHHHRCTACGVTDQSDPSMEFRYCTRCRDGLCYCANHIGTHEHV
jgi:hypothetical protein